MGWTGTHASYYKNGKVDRKREMDERWTQTEHDGYPELTVLKSQMVGSVYYAAIQSKKKGRETVVFGVTGLTHTNMKDYFNFTYKDIDETMGPCDAKCPISILKLLTPTDSEYANNWRKRCYEYNKQKKNGNWLDNLPLGGKIIYTNWNGEERVLIKHPPKYQFKRWFWFDEKNYKYISKKMITLNNSRLYEEVK